MPTTQRIINGIPSHAGTSPLFTRPPHSGHDGQISKSVFHRSYTQQKGSCLLPLASNSAALGFELTISDIASLLQLRTILKC